ncbi:hypothetical protein [Nitrobacter sp. JJSN]|uniref:hypothetical protein n=1 Tax=Nitrobacter sp. JJSN TaxID=3453033 RepID=UPI003F76FFD8
MAVANLGNQGQKFNSTIEEADKLTAELPTIAAAPAVWLTADAVSKLLRPALGFSTSTTVCKRLHGGLVRARCRQFMIGDKIWRQDAVIPREFWWAEGEAALKCNWVTGDFETWLDHKAHLRAFAVMFYRPDIEAMVPAQALSPADPVLPETVQSAPKGGRPTAEFWDDLWVEICRQVFVGELIPKRPADIQKAMQQWCSDHGHSDAPSTIKPRASKLWNAVFVERE